MPGPAWLWDGKGRTYVAVWPGEWMHARQAYWLHLRTGPVYLETGD
jgi:hypothetical protein